MATGSDSAIGADQQGLILALMVNPRAGRDELTGWRADGRLKINLTAPPVEGKANAALIKFLAKFLGLKKSQIEITSGQSSRQKTVRLQGLTRDELISRLPPNIVS
jgi:uncharacterized protein (TIGR00251 family)